MSSLHKIGMLCRNPSLMAPAFVSSFIKNRWFRPNANIDSRTHSFLSANLLVTKRCTLSCPWCYYSCEVNTAVARDSDMDLEFIDSLVSHRLMRNAKLYIVSGGEPLLNPQCFSIIDYLKRLRKVVYLFTNGTLIERCLWSLKKSDVDLISVSVYPSNINILCHVVPMISATKRVRLTKVVTPGDFESGSSSLRDLLAFAEESGVEGLKVRYMNPQDRHKADGTGGGIAAEVVQQYNAFAESAKLSNVLVDVCPIHGPEGYDASVKKKCRMAWTRVTVDNAGVSSLCDDRPPVCFNIFDETTYSHMNDPELVDQRRNLMSDGEAPHKWCRCCFLLPSKDSM